MSSSIIFLSLLPAFCLKIFRTAFKTNKCWPYVHYLVSSLLCLFLSASSFSANDLPALPLGHQHTPPCTFCFFFQACFSSIPGWITSLPPSNLKTQKQTRNNRKIIIIIKARKEKKKQEPSHSNFSWPHCLKLHLFEMCLLSFLLFPFSLWRLLPSYARWKDVFVYVYAYV